MILKINDDYRLNTDAMCIMIEKKRVIKENTKHHKAGEEVYNTIGFYGEFEHAYRAMVKHGLLEMLIYLAKKQNTKKLKSLFLVNQHR